MATGADLTFAIGLVPEKAIQHLAAKGLQVSEGWRSVDAETHARAFTVANVTKLDVLADIQSELARAQRDGLTMQQFRDNLIPALTRKGWFAPAGEPARMPDGTPPDPQTGELATQKRLTARRLKTIFQTNMQSSMMAGRYRELMANADRRPYFQYVAVMDGRTRPAHRAMHGRVLRANDPLWSSMWPPNGWGCRCRVRALDGAELDERGLQVESSAGRITTSTVPLPDGSTSTIKRYTPADGGERFSADAGFGSNPAQVQAVDRLAIQRAAQVLPERQIEGALHQLFTDPVRRAELEIFAATAREARRPMGARVSIGALSDTAVLKLADEGVSFDQAAPISIEDRLVGGVKAGRHADQGDALALDDWGNLPNVVASGRMLWDERNGTLIYAARAIAPKGPRNWVRLAVRPGAEVNDVRHAALVREADLKGYAVLRKEVAQ